MLTITNKNKHNMMRNKIKFIHFKTQWTHEDLEEDFNRVSKPLPFKNLPDGKYLVRGYRKSHSKEYWKLGQTWYLVSETTKDNGHYYCISCTYMLFPSIPTKEYELLNKCYNKLSKDWKRAVYGFNLWMKLRAMKKDIRLDLLKTEKTSDKRPSKSGI